MNSIKMFFVKRILGQKRRSVKGDSRNKQLYAYLFLKYFISLSEKSKTWVSSAITSEIPADTGAFISYIYGIF